MTDERAMLYYLVVFPGAAADWCDRQGLDYLPLPKNPRYIGVIFTDMKKAGKIMRQFHRSTIYTGVQS